MNDNKEDIIKKELPIISSKRKNNINDDNSVSKRGGARKRTTPSTSIKNKINEETIKSLNAEIKKMWQKLDHIEKEKRYA